jgi:hypothetical protein
MGRSVGGTEIDQLGIGPIEHRIAESIGPLLAIESKG